MAHQFIFIFLLIALSNVAFSQEKLFIPRNIQAAYEKGTRSPDGKPGAEYWQNSAEYIIDVEFDPVTYLINGGEKIVYYNNSPDTLKNLVLRLYPNIFKKGNARDYALIPEAVADGVSIKKLIVGNNEINLNDKNLFKVTNTIASIKLEEFIPPKSSIELSVEWSFNISPKQTLRVGVYDSTTVLVGYWYPQIAVYDDIDGWDNYNYSGQVEFYNDFASFDVKITLPNNFGVWATGELQNTEEVLERPFLNKLLSAKQSDTVINIITAADIKSSSIYKSEKQKNTWIYKASDVSDFAFAISDHYLWDGIRTIVDTSNNRSVFVQAIYPATSPDFPEVAQISKDIIYYFSNELPAIKFPFPSFIIFNNGGSYGGGMEFPMLVNDGSYDIRNNTVSLTAHETAHQYFPFYVGTNEKKYAFMDEGWAAMFASEYEENILGISFPLAREIVSYESAAGNENEIPPIISSASLSYSSYRISAYNRPAIAYKILLDVLGDQLFVEALQEFMNRWNGKHPIPYDFFFTFNDVTGQNLNWFWKPWFFEQGFPDLAIDKVTTNNSKAEIKIKKVGIIPTPIKLTISYEDGSSEISDYTAEVWKDGSETFMVEVNLTGILKEIKLGSIDIPDSNRENNLFVVH